MGCATQPLISERESDSVRLSFGEFRRREGRSGRRSEKLVDFLEELRESEDLHQSLREIVKNPRARNFPMVMKLIMAYDEERPAVRRETSGTQEITVRFEREGRRITRG